MIAKVSYGPPAKKRKKITKKMLSWNPLNPHVLLSSSTDVKTFWNKKKTFKLEIIFLNKSSTKKIEKKI